MDAYRQKTVLALRHVYAEGMGTLEAYFSAQGYGIRYIDVCYEAINSIDPLSADLVVVLGGPVSVYDNKTYPFIASELRFLEQRLVKDLPTLGICLGAQLIANALGARVYPGVEKEIGWLPIFLTQEGAMHPLRELVKETPVVPHWHGDTFDLPTGAEALASSRLYPVQAFSWGKHVLGLQFHPEVDTSGMAQWTTAYGLELSLSNVSDVASLMSDTSRWAPALNRGVSAFLSQWMQTYNVSRRTA